VLSLFGEYGVAFVPHYTPLHYLPFILRDGKLRSKPSLREEGFEDTHFRSKSYRHDQGRGFGEYAFLTLDQAPRILGAKLKGGFPHVAIEIPETAFDEVDFHLCRYNVAFTRVLRRDGLPGRPEGSGNGRYYEDKQIPSARTEADKREMLDQYLNDPKTMIEVLVPGALEIPVDMRITCFHDDDVQIAQDIVRGINCPQYVVQLSNDLKYKPKKQHQQNVAYYIDTALADPDWRGNGLEYDKV